MVGTDRFSISVVILTPISSGKSCGGALGGDRWRVRVFSTASLMMGVCKIVGGVPDIKWIIFKSIDQCDNWKYYICIKL